MSQATSPIDTLGRPLHDLRISVTDRCNFRCTYCMPAELFGERYHFLPRAELLTYEEIARLTAIFVGLGVSKVRVTGGEPLVRQDVDTLVGMLHRTAGVEDLTLTTNGVLLPEQAERLKAAGLDRVTVSLDSLDPEVFGEMNGRGTRPEAVLAGIDAAERAGLHPIKVNTVVERGVNDHTVVDVARHFKGTGHIVRFIEYMDVGNLNGWKRERVVASSELASMIDAVFPIEPLEPSYRGEVAERWRYRDGSGEIGFISSVTQPFCGDCTRARLSAEGVLYTCLFAANGTDLRDTLRSGGSDETLRTLLAGIWSSREDRYSERRNEDGKPPTRIEMSYIGG